MSKKLRRATTSAKKTVRNPLATAPLLRKGAVHERSVKAERQRFKARLRRGEHDHASDLLAVSSIICLVVFHTLADRLADMVTIGRSVDEF